MKCKLGESHTRTGEAEKWPHAFIIINLFCYTFLKAWMNDGKNE